jgi:coenzyme F420 hydrogenase subunit beta
MKMDNVRDVVKWRLCVGCGACAYICPEKKIGLADKINEGIRPVLHEIRCKSCSECLRICPGLEISKNSFGRVDLLSELRSGWGDILEIFEGYATDSDVHYKGSSGGVASAIALYCVEKGKMHGILHIGADDKQGWMNKTVLSRNRLDLLSRTGSRYSPASPCDDLDQVESAPRPCVFIGKPCDVSALRKAQTLRNNLDNKVGVTIGIFCAGTPSTMGSIELFNLLKIEPIKVAEVRYRGMGWPGMFMVRLKGDKTPSHKMTYMESWGFLQRYRPFRCYLCPDGTSEFADISCGDPWYRKPQEGEAGSSLVLVRTDKGRKIIQGAIKEGYVVLERRSPPILEKSQQNLLAKRRAIWGRLLAMKAFGIPTPSLRGFHLFENWCALSAKEKARSLLGTARRIIQRKYYRPLTLT